MPAQFTVNDLLRFALSGRTEGVAMTVDSMQNKYRDSFTAALTGRWDQTLAAGATATVSAGQLTFGSGVAVNGNSTIVSREMFTIPFRFSFAMSLSQRIVNQTLWVEIVSCDPDTGVLDNQHSAAWRFDGTTATQAIYEVQNGGLTRLASAASTINTTASLNVHEIEPFGDEAWFHSTAIDSTAGRTQSYRRHQQIPDPNATYKIRLRWLNGATAPASSTNAVFQFVSVLDNCELTAEITAGRGGSSAGQGVPVIPASAFSLAAGSTIAPAVPTTPYILNSAATTNGALVITGTSGLQGLYATNTGATDAFIKLYNKATAPTVGTDVPVMIVPVPAAVSGRPGVAQISPGFSGYRFALGLGIAITGGAADADTTAVAAGQVKVILTRTT